jgi:glycosyltransferase involved in cell wall biosynthesis
MGEYLAEAVLSVLGQKGERVEQVTELEVLVIDDHNEDPETHAAFDNVTRLDPRVTVLRNEGLNGSAASRNVGIRNAKGDWIAFLDADDIWLEHALEVRLAALEGDKSVGVISADMVLWIDTEQIDLEGFFATRPKPRKLLAEAFDSGKPVRFQKPVAQLLESSFLWPGVVMARKEALIEAGLFDEDLMRAEDVNMWVRLAQRVDFMFVPEVIALYRQHPGAITQRDEPPGYWGVLAYKKLLLDSAFEQHRAALQNRIARYMAADAYYHRKKGNYREAVWTSLKWLQLAKRNPTAWRNLLAALLRL